MTSTKNDKFDPSPPPSAKNKNMPLFQINRLRKNLTSFKTHTLPCGSHECMVTSSYLFCFIGNGYSD